MQFFCYFASFKFELDFHRIVLNKSKAELISQQFTIQGLYLSGLVNLSFFYLLANYSSVTIRK